MVVMDSATPVHLQRRCRWMMPFSFNGYEVVGGGGGEGVVVIVPEGRREVGKRCACYEVCLARDRPKPLGESLLEVEEVVSFRFQAADVTV